MKLLLCLSVLALAALVQAGTELHPRGCRYIMGRCVEDCEEGTHAYTTGCGKKTPEATCEEPHPVEEEGNICDYSDCYCDPPTVRDTASNKCVKLEDCPKGGEAEKTAKEGVL